VIVADQFRQISEEDAQQLRESTFVNDMEHHAVLPSTNSHALGLAAVADLNLPVLVLADRQTAGRGRGGNRWWSGAGALTFSLILERPESSDGVSWIRVALTTGMAVCEALHELCPGVDAALKWPNDVFVRSRKICGVLVETVPQTPRRIVLGVGVNVNNSVAGAPMSVRSSGISLLEVAGYPFRLASVLSTILSHLSAHLVLLQREPVQLQRRWETHCMLTGKRVHLVAGSRRVRGCCLGIDAHGALLIETPAGVDACLSGEVIWWA